MRTQLTTTTKLPVDRLTKKEIVWLAKHQCKHKHNYLSHYGCFHPPIAPERIGFFDIETSNLDANFGIMLSYAILDGTDGTITGSVISAGDIAKAKPGQEDRRITQLCIADLQRFDRIVGYYSKRFDVPYVRTRALIDHLPFPAWGSIIHTDLYDVIKRKFKLHSNRLENACRVLLGTTNKTHIDTTFWRGGVRGDSKSLKYIWDHNTADVVDLKALYDKTIEFVNLTDSKA